MITMKMIFFGDNGKRIVRNVPIDLIDDIDELPLYELKEMNLFTDYDVIYISSPSNDFVESILYN